METIKTAVVGVGHLGSRHARIYSELPGVELVGVVDSDPERAREVARQYGTRFFASPDDLPDSVEAVSVVVPTDRHYQVSAPLLQRGFHLLIEKPITALVAEAEELHRIASARSLMIQVGHVERFNPAILAVEKILHEPRFIECHRLAPFQKRGTEVSVVLDLMIHDLEIILHLVDSPVESLEAVGTAVLSPSEDIANARVRFRSGCIANITASRVSPDRVRKIRIFQDDAYISLDYNAQQAEVYRRQAGRIVSEILQTERGEPLKLEIGSFVESVRLGGRPQVPAEHGLSALRLAGEILASIDRERKKIDRLREKALQGW